MFQKVVLPTTQNISDAVEALWRAAFGEGEIAGTRNQFAGKERDANSDTIYLLWQDNRLAACCMITRKNNTPYGVLGGVVSNPTFRGQGFGKRRRPDQRNPGICH